MRLTALVLTVLAILALFWLSRLHFPAFEGKTLVSWLVDYNPNTGGVKSDKAASVIRNAGTNALPELIHLISKNTPRLNRFKYYLWRWLPFLQRSPQVDLQWKATAAFKLLGAQAKPAAPMLGELLDQARNPGYVSTSLGYIGPDGLPYLMRAMTNQDSMVRFAAIKAIALLGTNALPAVPELQKALQDTQGIVVETATAVLKQLGTDKAGASHSKE